MESTEIEIVIDEKFEKLLPRKSEDSLKRLEKSLLLDGIKDPLKVWQDPETGEHILIDGHHRYAIAKRHPELTYRVEIIKNLVDDDGVIAWMVNNALQVRTNEITDFERNRLVLMEKDALARLAEKRMRAGIKLTPETLGSADPRVGRTADILAERAGTSGSSIKRTAKILKEASPEVIEKASTGEISISAAYKTIKKDEKPAEERKDVEPTTGMTLEELEDSIIEETSIEDFVKEQAEELRRLHRRIETLTTTDKDAELVKKDDIIFSLEQRIGMLTDQNYQKWDQLRYNTRLLADIRKLLGVVMNSEILNAIKALKGM